MRMRMIVTRDRKKMSVLECALADSNAAALRQTVQSALPFKDSFPQYT
jgi:hypothetical protein